MREKKIESGRLSLHLSVMTSWYRCNFTSKFQILYKIHFGASLARNHTRKEFLRDVIAEKNATAFKLPIYIQYM